MSRKKEYIFMWSQAPIMPSYWATPQALKEREDIYPISEIFQYYDGKVITAYMPKEQIERHKKTSGKKFLSPNYFQKYRITYKKRIAQWWKWIREIEKKDYSKITVNQLKRDHQRFTEYMRDSISYFGSTRPEFTYCAEQRLEQILKKYFRGDWAKVFGILAEAVELDEVQIEHLEKLKLLSSRVTDKALGIHISKFPWLVFGQFSEKKAASFLRNNLRKEKEDYKEINKEYQKKKKELKQKQEEIYKQLNGDKKEARYLASFLQTQSIERMNIKSYWAGCYYLSRNMWYKIRELLNLSLDDLIKFVTPPEIQQLLNKKYPGNIKEVISLRKKSFAIYYQRGNDIKIFNYKKADDLFKEKIKKSVSKDKVIKGQSASLGVYKGKVRKVIAGDLDMLQDSIKKFKKGEVLVTSMTQPNMMIIARKAGAIIADEGGITSHAAIISRELKIPCIVGCFKSMQSLKDGDLVEVDAEKGVVKILSK